ncbi:MULTISPECIES: LacI family DNA-binding transcriptional regulator [Cellulomonas]|uniref:LacI family DNA-binding transcriptional regulator n=1 Tax=Cellulomonas TaxID=1707 RepID=UPI001B951275|nr:MULTISPECIES: LacI family DNA-binding transcriptional regulator [Cellulomonas]VTR77994.1 HTH-type transcriptional regulator DegA [Cellulomonas hominis]
MPRTTTTRRSSIGDVARLAGVSVGTVSNVLNRPDRVAQPTRDRVLDAIQRLSFVPNASARQLRAGTITTVGAIVLDIRNPFFTEAARGVEDRLALADHTLMLASSDDDPEREARYLRLFEEHGVSGLLVVPTGDDLGPLLALAARGVHTVLLDMPSPTDSLSSVAVDDVAGGRMAGEHLLSLGHREILMLNGPHSIRQCRDRLAGLHRAVERHGLDPDAVVREVRIPSLDAGGAAAAFAPLLEEDPAPRAVFCVNDLAAIGVQREIRRRRPDLLGRTAIVGYDDIEIAAELATPLTSVRQPAHDVGYRAADVLLSRDADGNPVREHVVFQPELVVRSTSVPA